MPICGYLSRIILLLLRQAISEKVIINLHVATGVTHYLSMECHKGTKQWVTGQI